MPRSPDHPIFTPTRLFRVILLQTKALTKILPCATLGWPKGGPRVAQASPKPNPRQAEGRKSLPVLANCQLLIAQFSKNFRFHTLGRCRTIAISFAHINSELVHGLNRPTPQKHISFGTGLAECRVLTADCSRADPPRGSPSGLPYRAVSAQTPKKETRRGRRVSRGSGFLVEERPFRAA
jgi:hypothetical protein